MRKIASVLLVTAILMSSLIPVSAAGNTIQPYYINTNQARVVMSINESGRAEISVIVTVNSKAEMIQTTTYLERKVGSTWVRVNNGEINNEWIATSTASYLSKNYSCQLNLTGTYRAVAEILVTGAGTDSFTLYFEDVY